jgi:hypothetical protein
MTEARRKAWTKAIENEDSNALAVICTGMCDLPVVQKTTELDAARMCLEKWEANVLADKESLNTWILGAHSSTCPLCSTSSIAEYKATDVKPAAQNPGVKCHFCPLGRITECTHHESNPWGQAAIRGDKDLLVRALKIAVDRLEMKAGKGVAV